MHVMFLKILPRGASEAAHSLLTINNMLGDSGVKQVMDFLCNLYKAVKSAVIFFNTREGREWQVLRRKEKNRSVATLVWKFVRVLMVRWFLSSVQKGLPREAMAFNYSYSTSFLWTILMTSIQVFYLLADGLSPVCTRSDILFKCCVTTD